MSAEASDIERRAAFILSLREAGISDRRVLGAMEQVPREAFVDPELASLALEDHALPIACGQTISQPYIVAYMTEKLGVEPTHKVLEIGTGSGYQAAILGRLANEVVTVERYRTLADLARERMTANGISNVEVRIGDGMLGAADKAPYDRIIVTAAAAEMPGGLLDQLAEGGILIAPVGPEGAVQALKKYVRTTDGIEESDLLPVRFVPLLPGIARQL